MSQSSVRQVLAFVAPLPAVSPISSSRLSRRRSVPLKPLIATPSSTRPIRLCVPPPPSTPPSPPQDTSSTSPSDVKPTSFSSTPLSPPATVDTSHDSENDSNLRADILATVTWITAAAATAGVMGKVKGLNAALQFITAYIVEYSLSVDNLFVFLLIFSYFQVSRRAQGRVLSFGIAGAVAFRAIMIVAGEALTQRFKAVTVAFAAFLLFSAFKIVASGGDDDNEDVSQSPVVKFASKLLPFSDEYDGDNFFTFAADGRRLATPLMLVLLSVEFSDVVFALDSVPAVLGISDDVAVIYLSNIFAIAGLRNLFFVLSDAIGDLRFLPQALAAVLAFVGSKMIAGVAGYEVPVVPSLVVVVGALAAGIGLSVAFPKHEAGVDKA